MLTSTLSQRQFPHGAPSTTSHLTFLALHETQALAARLLVTFASLLESERLVLPFLPLLSLSPPLIEAGDPGVPSELLVDDGAMMKVGNQLEIRGASLFFSF